MKFSILISAIVLVSASSIASETQKESATNKTLTYDHKKYCYYADKEYSKGSILKQVDELKVCTVSHDGTLVWTKK